MLIRFPLISLLGKWAKLKRLLSPRNTSCNRLHWDLNEVFRALRLYAFVGNGNEPPNLLACPTTLPFAVGSCVKFIVSGVVRELRAYW